MTFTSDQVLIHTAVKILWNDKDSKPHAMRLSPVLGRPNAYIG